MPILYIYVVLVNHRHCCGHKYYNYQCMRVPFFFPIIALTKEGPSSSWCRLFLQQLNNNSHRHCVGLAKFVSSSSVVFRLPCLADKGPSPPAVSFFFHIAPRSPSSLNDHSSGCCRVLDFGNHICLPFIIEFISTFGACIIYNSSSRYF